MATWNGFRQEAKARDAMSLSEIAQLAHDVAGEKHRFRFVQLPFNLGMTEALYAWQSVRSTAQAKTVMEAASELGYSLIASGSLLQGQVTRNLARVRLAQALGLQNDAERACNSFARPGNHDGLVACRSPSMSRPMLAWWGSNPQESTSSANSPRGNRVKPPTLLARRIG
jgi:hypothetical protein